MKAAVLFEVNKPLVIEEVSVPNPGPQDPGVNTPTGMVTSRRKKARQEPSLS